MLFCIRRPCSLVFFTIRDTRSAADRGVGAKMNATHNSKLEMMGRGTIDQTSKFQALESNLEARRPPDLPVQCFLCGNTTLQTTLRMANYAGTTGRLSKLCKENRLEEALEVVEFMNKQAVPISREVVYCLLQGCTRSTDLSTIRRVSSLIVNAGLDSVPILGDHLIRLFAFSGSLAEANQVFQNVPTPSVYTWHSILSANVRLGQSAKALELFDKMQQSGIKPDKFILSCILKACGIERTIHKGKLLHDHIIRRELDIDVILGNGLVDMYAKCGNLEEAHKVFETLPCRDVVSWAVLISGYIQHGHALSSIDLFKRSQQDGLQPDKFIFSGTLKACGSIGDIEQGRLVHDQIIRSGLIAEVVVWSTLVDMYVKCDRLQEAQIVFEELPIRDAVSWGAMIVGYAQLGHDLLALRFFEKMWQEGIEPDKVTFSCILKVCGSTGNERKGQLIHGQIIKSGLEADVIIGSALVDMYCKCSNVGEARKVFDKIFNRDVVSWSTMIGGYVQHEDGIFALELFDKMQQEGIEPCKVTLMSSLKACWIIGDLEQGRLIHGHILKNGLASDIAVGSTLVDMYVKCGSLEEAHLVFDSLHNPDAVLWGIMIAGYAQHGKDLAALELFDKMRRQSTDPSKVTLSYILKACGTMGALGQGRLIHSLVIKIGIEIDVVVSNTLVDMYAKCGSLAEAQKAFDDLPNRDVVSWGAMIVGHARYGNRTLAMQFLQDMHQQGLEPNDVVFISILAVCSHFGLLEVGQGYFKQMREKYGIVPSLYHYSCMVDLLGRAGYFDEVEDLLQTLPAPPNLIMWTSLLTSCRIYGNVELGRRCFDEFVQLNLNFASGYVLMSKMFTDAHMWEDAGEIQELKKCAGAWKKPGKAWIQLSSNVHEFVVGEINHPNSSETYSILMTLISIIKKEGYVPQSELSSKSTTEEDTEDILCVNG